MEEFNMPKSYWKMLNMKILHSDFRFSLSSFGVLRWCCSYANQPPSTTTHVSGWTAKQRALVSYYIVFIKLLPSHFDEMTRQDDMIRALGHHPWTTKATIVKMHVISVIYSCDLWARMRRFVVRWFWYSFEDVPKKYNNNKNVANIPGAPLPFLLIPDQIICWIHERPNLQWTVSGIDWHVMGGNGYL